MEFMHSLEDDIYEGFRKYYEAKYGRSMDNDLIMQYYLDRRTFDVLIASNYYLPRDNESGEVMVVQEKNYFNEPAVGREKEIKEMMPWERDI